MFKKSNAKIFLLSVILQHSFHMTNHFVQLVYRRLSADYRSSSRRLHPCVGCVSGAVADGQLRDRGRRESAAQHPLQPLPAPLSGAEPWPHEPGIIRKTHTLSILGSEDTKARNKVGRGIFLYDCHLCCTKYWNWPQTLLIGI